MRRAVRCGCAHRVNTTFVTGAADPSGGAYRVYRSSWYPSHASAVLAHDVAVKAASRRTRPQSSAQPGLLAPVENSATIYDSTMKQRIQFGERARLARVGLRGAVGGESSFIMPRFGRCCVLRVL